MADVVEVGAKAAKAKGGGAWKAALIAISKFGFLKFGLKRLASIAEKNEDMVIGWIVTRIKVTTDERERMALRYIYDHGLEAFRAVLAGKDVEWLASKQACAVAVLNLIHDNVENFLGPQVDIPAVPEWLEEFAATGIKEVIEDYLLPWAQNKNVPRQLA